jgi:hypothetical protein
MDERSHLYAVDEGRPAPLMGIAGVDGESYDYYSQAFSGGPDSNPLLAGRAKFAIFNEMARSDPAVSSLLWMIGLPIRQAVWDLQPASSDGEDVLRRDALAWQFGIGIEEGRLDLTWDEQLAQMLLMLKHGSIFEEDVWGAPEEAMLDEGRTVFLRPLLRCAPRSPSSIVQIGSDNVEGVIRWIRQDLPGAQPIPGSKLSWFVLEREGQNWYGNSLLRPVFGAWRMKRALLISSAIAWDRWASGIPFVRHPDNTEAQKRAEQIGRDARTHERAYVAMATGPDWDFSIESTGAIADPTPLLSAYNSEIAIRGLQQFGLLGRQGASGSRALAETQARPAYQAIRAIAEALRTNLMRQRFRRWMDVNFGPQYPVPKLSYARLDPEPLSNLAQALANLSGAGFTFSDRDTQNDIRARMELPELPEEAQAALDAANATVAPMADSLPLEAIPGGPVGRLRREGDGLGLNQPTR